MGNPLLTEAGLPPFSHIEVGHVGPAIDAGTGEGFMPTFLEHGGTREPIEMFVQFRGREPEIAPLLRRWGVAA